MKNGPIPRTSLQSNRQDYTKPSWPEARNKSTWSATQPTSSAPSSAAEIVQVNLSKDDGTTILPTAVVQIEHLGEKFTVRALIATGSEKSFLLKSIQQNLSIPLDSRRSEISGFGAAVEDVMLQLNPEYMILGLKSELLSCLHWLTLCPRGLFQFKI